MLQITIFVCLVQIPFKFLGPFSGPEKIHSLYCKSSISMNVSCVQEIVLGYSNEITAQGI